MITQEQVYSIAKKKKINEATILREYLQLFFLNELYSLKKSEKIIFKGGTALHLIYKAPRFSEDLDFTVELSKNVFLEFIKKIFKQIAQKESIEFKERKTIKGKRFLMTALPTVLPYRTFVNLDFSFREKVINPQKSIIKIEDYPILFTSYIYHLSKEEIFAEKIRAILTRTKGRDLYDLWYLMNINTDINKDWIIKKLKYYKANTIEKKKLIEKIKTFRKKDFILDLRPFIPINEREKLGNLFNFIQDFLITHLSNL